MVVVFSATFCARIVMRVMPSSFVINSVTAAVAMCFGAYALAQEPAPVSPHTPDAPTAAITPQQQAAAILPAALQALGAPKPYLDVIRGANHRSEEHTSELQSLR